MVKRTYQPNKRKHSKVWFQKTHEHKNGRKVARRRRKGQYYQHKITDSSVVFWF
ncbi:50S ribosomal protein L34 [Staphylococcus xylosus]|uniref:50S ribosomal protein L34 n=1 Tax=Staphylococcus xylosus TaxID=1288 RepID=A0A939NIT4_STAXY|nr:50S ribosomal protein L34 [Staphylococcus xylosus]